MNIFSKSSKKPKKTSASDDDTGRLSPSPSPPKKSHFRPGKDKDKDENRRPGTGPSRNSSTFSRTQSFSPILDPNSHPLNLPPDQLRRLSALSNMSGEPFQMEPMEVDHEIPNGNSSPPLQPPQSAPPSSSNAPTSKPVNGSTNNGTASNKAPTPPPHKSAPTSPIASQAPTPEEAEAFKTAGNKYYKAREYKKAIEEYTKGRFHVRMS
jgi:DnaJ homolog subfamily C member 7